MKKFLLVLFILVDLVILAIAILFLIARMRGTEMPTFGLGGDAAEQHSPMTPKHPTPAASSPTSSSTSTPAGLFPSSAASSTTGGANTRNILFTYRNPKAKKVTIRADFTGWRAEPMEKDPATGQWKYMAVLEPGQYAYVYSVDDRPIRDPANKQTKTVGKTVVSAITVQPLAATSGR